MNPNSRNPPMKPKVLKETQKNSIEPQRRDPKKRPKEPKGTPGYPKDPHGTPRNLKEPQGTPRNPFQKKIYQEDV